MKNIEELIVSVQNKHSEGMNIKEIIDYLSDKNISKYDLIIILSKALNIEIHYAKELVLAPYKGKISDQLLDDFLSDKND